MGTSSETSPDNQQVGERLEYLPSIQRAQKSAPKKMTASPIKIVPTIKKILTVAPILRSHLTEPRSSGIPHLRQSPCAGRHRRASARCGPRTASARARFLRTVPRRQTTMRGILSPHQSTKRQPLLPFSGDIHLDLRHARIWRSIVHERGRRAGQCQQSDAKRSASELPSCVGRCGALASASRFNLSGHAQRFRHLASEI